MPKATGEARMKPRALCREFLFDESMQMISYRWMIEPLDYFVQKAGDEEALGDFRVNPARA